MRWGVEVFYRTTKQSVAAILARGGDPLSWSAALARRRVRESMRQGRGEGPVGPRLVDQLGQATKDTYTRAKQKKARDWPHKKKDKPPGNPKIVVAKAKEIRSAKKVKERKTAA